ncbi:hypothetical protein BJY04DRAFT_218775 [Aspergillus karnatakaensis]|uniref:uncharacterized protein n=1 Tax=Aspergillus karnatakaensis TaxID=1810916 RepID=UPI003CCE192F
MDPRMSRNPNVNDPSSFTGHFNENVDYTRDKASSQGHGENLAQTQADAQAHIQSQTGGPSMKADRTRAGAGMGAVAGDKNATLAETSIDSTNAGVDHRRTSYSFTAATLSHPDDKTAPDE